MEGHLQGSAGCLDSRHNKIVGPLVWNIRRCTHLPRCRRRAWAASEQCESPRGHPQGRLFVRHAVVDLGEFAPSSSELACTYQMGPRRTFETDFSTLDGGWHHIGKRAFHCFLLCVQRLVDLWFAPFHTDCALSPIVLESALLFWAQLPNDHDCWLNIIACD